MGIAPCSLVDIGWRFSGTYCLHHQHKASVQCRSMSSRLQTATSQKTAILRSLGFPSFPFHHLRPFLRFALYGPCSRKASSKKCSVASANEDNTFNTLVVFNRLYFRASAWEEIMCVSVRACSISCSWPAPTPKSLQFPVSQKPKIPLTDAEEEADARQNLNPSATLLVKEEKGKVLREKDFLHIFL